MQAEFAQISAQSTRYQELLVEKHPQYLNAIKKHDALTQAFGLSEFIGDSVLVDPELLECLLTHPMPPTGLTDYKGLLAQHLTHINDEAVLLKKLRSFRRWHMALLAYWDLLNFQTIEQSLQQTSALADALINGAYHWLYDFFCQKYGQPQGPFGPQPLLILGMGKLGGKELNFSSDIDLIFCYPANGEITGQRKPLEHQQFFTRLAQRLIHALNHTDSNGRVFRVDMRLRPLGESGPLVMHFSALEDYYQEQGREWERYAMIKARVINADCHYAKELITILQPFIYRRYLDYSAIDSLRSMKSLITQEVRRRGLKNNIKLGQGGIREVEFIAQSFQLIKGGRIPALQTPSLLETLRALSELEFMPDTDVEQLTMDYFTLRKVEHCLQQFADQQTQLLPEDEADQQRLCKVLRSLDYLAVERQILQTMTRINLQFQSLIGDTSDTESDLDDPRKSEFSDLWMLALEIQDIRQLFSQYVEDEVALNLSKLVVEFKQNVQHKRPSTKALQTLDILMPGLFNSIVNEQIESTAGCEADILFERISHILLCVLKRTTYLQLLVENPGAQGQLVKLCYASSWIASHLAKHPILLDELLNPLHLYNPTPLSDYPSELRQILLRVEPNDLELQMETLRQFKQIQQLKIAAADVTGVLPVMKVSDHLTYLAEAIIAEVVNMAWEQMTNKYGYPEGSDDQNKRFAVLGYGKLGGIELGYGSDLDLVFIHAVQQGSRTLNDKPLESGQFYTRLAQRIMHLFVTVTPSGQLYDVDMRLRPSGNAGLLVCHLHGFEHYQLQEAWTWEHQALVRARVVYAETSLQESIESVRRQVLCMPRDQSKLKTDVSSMRQKMREHLNKGDQFWLDVKQDTGAIADIEFLVQFWVLANASAYPELCEWSDNVRLLETLENLHLISTEYKQQLVDAYLDYRNSSHRLTLLDKDNLMAKSQFLEHQENVTSIWQHTFDGDTYDSD
ncbi:bifunctional [glutamate--ammonia ligase]-adenylyl-L-tyrosine phosphorylase/[glutamate--ammonia-ligase] adenylyltransferase [Aliiglaciecola sp. M165]|uniref:bifunctional [glutamate--ammonia ligase]-adenylyl-L-tyrosine phosphorylase/[glutamate--ammonia-ligase] adenylyltransferase n=1 Tax=Aliiglaciecola sp. M165 TaxID=2593649 RepID=UPI00117FCF64|nr:bifunctional [glutamate--ammonia ligase]-adenylyl-L-tyrosine phosphorylase/[glutamate--ammonia-ligase] adenylyltransferase [Aliiglaciecola sp. M165]TRY30797.1 bifunctional [glutamate--ammonia ligase]-adenylyl-L-tyrosine phosphorylase/[glutamate--ammonia-ligase] adenylyltransferase [Aliiglaciecola sp. M165]